MCISSFFLDRFLSLCDLGWSGPCFIDQASLRLRYPLPQGLRLKACATMAGKLYISLETYSLFSDFVQLKECRTMATTVYWSADDDRFSCSWLSLGASALHNNGYLQLILRASTYFKVLLLKRRWAFLYSEAAVPLRSHSWLVSVYTTVLCSLIQSFLLFTPKTVFHVANNWILLCSWGWPWTHNPSASTSQVLGSWATMFH